MRGLRWFCGASIAAAVATVAPTPAAAETAVFSGVCTVTLEVGFTAPVGITPAGRAMSLAGGGSCVVNGEQARLTFSGSLATTSVTGGYACAGGVATGTGVVEIAIPGFPGPVVQLVVAEVDGVVTMSVLAPVTRFDGVASLLRDPDESVACATTGYSRTTWTGLMPFQDPYPAPL